MCWRYIGKRKHRRVEVYAAAMPCGPGAEDFATVWRVRDGEVDAEMSVWLAEMEAKQ